MNSAIYQFGRFAVLTFDTEQELNKLWPQLLTPGKKITSFSSFFQSMVCSYLLAVDTKKDVRLNEDSRQRLLQIARDNRAGFVYSDYIDEIDKKKINHPLNDYQLGSIRDDFNFGYVMLFSCNAMRAVIEKHGDISPDPEVTFYDLRLKISINYPIIHVPEFLYTAVQKKQEAAGQGNALIEKHFGYAADFQRTRQKKLEKIATAYLKLIDAYLQPRNKKTTRQRASFPVEASVVIPVFNRKKTIATAIKSALGQKTDFSYNIIVIDNHSIDGTGSVIRKLAVINPDVHHIIPQRRDLLIGGCWNEAINSSFCGRYSIQLDSDDLYASPYVLQNIVDTLRNGNLAMVVGSYTIVNEQLKPILPGLIDHREWTQANGHNNALRINGFGAPRAFHTGVLRQIRFPNVSYGEDYAVALRISRHYRIGRIYESIYLCRRWSGNTDAALTIEQQNRNDFYKDKLRSLEILARQTMNEGK